MNRIDKEGKRFDITGLGSCALDLLSTVPSFPKPDTKDKMIRFIQQVRQFSWLFSERAPVIICLNPLYVKVIGAESW